MRTRLSWHYLNVGTGFMGLGDQEGAEPYFRKAIDIQDDISQLARASAYANLGFCYFDKKEYNEALELFDRAEHVYKENSEEDYYNFSVIESWRGRLYAETGKRKLAREHFALAFEYADQIEDYMQLSSVSKDIATFYAEEGDYKNAYEYQLLYDRMGEKYLEQVNERKQLELEIKYEAEKKKQETEMLKLEATKLQLKALRAQMNPHFMYNALNSIQNFITSNEITFAAKYLAKFARLMRQSLDYSDLEIISLEKEVEFLDDYLYINEKLRFEDSLKYTITIDDEIEEDILGVPTMIVQPYVENAIEHGLRTKKNGLIQLNFKMLDEDTILCVIEDNGIGREKARQLQMQDAQYQNHRSKGTFVTEKRLQILHNSKEKGVFVETIDLTDPESGEALGTRVEIKIPIVEIQIK
jgi:tetratricopeptide (TPR) repeat protein